MRNYITGRRVADSIRMLRLVQHDAAFLLVEGETDKRMFKKFVDEDRCRVQSADGKHQVLDAIAILNAANIKGVLGCIDADFSHAEGKTCGVANVVVTDTHDIETMMLKSSALENLLAEFADYDKLAAFEQQAVARVRDVLLQSASRIGYLRWFSLIHNAGYNFDAIRYEVFVDGDTLAVDLEKLVHEAISQASAPQIVDEAVTIARLRSMAASAYDPWQISCGHDTVRLLLIGLKKIFGDYNALHLTSGWLEGALRISFRDSEFTETAVYEAMRLWERGNPPYQVMRRGMAQRPTAASPAV